MTQTTCPYPVMAGLGQCCGDNPCSVQWACQCDKDGGCYERSTCGGCEYPVFKGDPEYEQN